MSFRYEKPRESITLYIKVAMDNRWFIRLIKLKPSKVLIAPWDKIDITCIPGWQFANRAMTIHKYILQLLGQNLKVNDNVAYSMKADAFLKRLNPIRSESQHQPGEIDLSGSISL
jgi:pyridoxine 5'-phosphate synthase PdxJ